MIRIPDFTDLSDKHQVRDMVRLLRSVRSELSRTAMPVEALEADPSDNRFRVVQRTVDPTDPSFDADQHQEVHFFVGGKWMRVVLEDL